MDLKIQIQLAVEAGKVNRPGYEDRTWEDEYKYHIGMVSNPLPFGQFRLKFDRLNRMFEADPDSKNRSYDRPIMELCNQLGY
jgi:hypothetical protein